MDLTSSTPSILLNGVSSTTNKRRNNSYKFPILKQSDIIQCLKELVSGSGNDNSNTNNIVLTKEELEEPQHCKEKIRNIFTFLLSYCAGKDESAIQKHPSKPVLEFIQNELEYPELHMTDSFFEMEFFLAVRTLMEQCCYTEFSWRDLYTPSSKRLRIQLSAIINLIKYLEGEQIKIFNELNGPRSELINALEEAQAEQDELKKTYEVVETNATKKRNEMDAIIRECEQLEIEIARNNKLQTATRQEAAEIKKKVNDLNDKVQTAQWALQEVEADEEKLRGQVVSNPEQYKNELNKKMKQLQKEKDECTRLDDAIQQCKMKYTNTLKLYQNISNCMKDMDELKDEATKYADIVAKSDAVRKVIDDTTRTVDAINEQIVDTEREVIRIDEKVKSQRVSNQIKLHAIQESIDATKQDLLYIEKERRDTMVRIDMWEKQIYTLQTTIDNERTNAENEINAMISNYKIVETKFINKCNNRMNHLQMKQQQDENENEEQGCGRNTSTDCSASDKDNQSNKETLISHDNKNKENEEVLL